MDADVGAPEFTSGATPIASAASGGIVELTLAVASDTVRYIAMFRDFCAGMLIAGALLAVGCGPTARALPPPPAKIDWDPDVGAVPTRPGQHAPPVDAAGQFLMGE